MSDLPKRGDRVRVTEVPERCPGPARDHLGKEYVLAKDAAPHPLHRGFCVFSPEPEGWVSPVKVEILERATSSVMDDEAWINAGCPSIPDPESDYTRGRRDGMRVVARLATELLGVKGATLGEFAEAIEKELENG